MKGLGSIRPIRAEGDIVFIRPLLCLCKKEILGFLSALGESYVTDVTNADTDYTRNYIRHKLLPGFERINPAYLSNINKAAMLCAVKTQFRQCFASHLTLYGHSRLVEIFNFSAFQLISASRCGGQI